MRAIRIAMTTLLVSGLSSFAYARVPVSEAAHISAALMATPGVAGAQDAPEAKPPRAEKQEKPAKESKADKKRDKEQAKADKKQDKHESKSDKKQDKNQAKMGQKEDKKGGGQHGHIKDSDYKAHFGQEHKVSAKRVITTTHIVPNQTRFTYVGYTFMFVDPWPMGWGFDDDVYIDYVDGGYYMFDMMHPGVQVGLSIVF